MSYRMASSSIGISHSSIQYCNHANFGNYGVQRNDGEAAVSRESQQAQTATAIAELADL